MLPSKNRLSGKPDFERIKTEGRLLTGRYFGLIFIVEGQKPPRFGFIVSNRISQKAVLRNRAKRLLREAVRILLSKIKDGVMALFLAKKTLLKMPLPEVLAETERLFKKGQLLK